MHKTLELARLLSYECVASYMSKVNCRKASDALKDVTLKVDVHAVPHLKDVINATLDL